MLRNPLWSLPRWGRVHHQARGIYAPYDPVAITHQMQSAILTYYAQPPRNDEGYVYWLTVLASRQTGKSTSAEYAAYPVTAFTPGHDHACIADTRDRANYLHGRVHGLHLGWKGALRAPTVPVRESRQLTFDPLVGGRMRVLSAESPAVGIGQSPDSLHASECAFWADFHKTMSFIYPSIRNRKEARVLFECTPWQTGSSWHEHWRTAFGRTARRHLGLFFPFWDGKLNIRKWPRGDAGTHEEQRLMDDYGPMGLTWSNLAFRREVLEDDPEIRRNPELFNIFYPFDPVRCWIIGTGGAIPKTVVESLRANDLEAWKGPLQIYKRPSPDAQYVVAVDPSGYGARDHAAIQVFEVWDDRWEQVATYADVVDPPTLWRMVERLCKQYNRALLIVERNGVGASILSLAQTSGYHNLFYEKRNKPGFWTSDSSAQAMISWLSEAAEAGRLFLHDSDLVDQCATYKNDKLIERTARTEALAVRADGRRDRHHWDKVSALLMAIVGARSLPARRRRYDREYSGSEIVLMPGVHRQDVERDLQERRLAKIRRGNPWRTGHKTVYRTKRRF
jgi:hypothetical protein